MLEDHSARRLALGSAGAGGSFHDGRDRNKAREAAEALFAPKRRVSEPALLNGTQTAAQEAPRKPRILSIALRRAPEPAAPAVAAPVVLEKPAQAPPTVEEPPPPPVPPSHMPRVRSWLKYGMTVRQVAQIYGVAVGEIERVLQRA